MSSVFFLLLQAIWEIEYFFLYNELITIVIVRKTPHLKYWSIPPWKPGCQVSMTAEWVTLTTLSPEGASGRLFGSSVTRSLEAPSVFLATHS